MDAAILAVLVMMSGATPAPAPQPIEHVVVVVFENTNAGSALAQKNFKAFAVQGVLFSQMQAETHPSQGNYVAMVSGGLQGVTGDGVYELQAPTIADLIEKKGLTWKMYAEDYPGNCFTGNHGKYVRKHTPFISFPKLRARSCAKIVNSAMFGREPLPNVSWFIPNLNNDGHDTGVAYADAWFGKNFGPLLKNPEFMKNTLVIATFDENEGASGNKIYTAMVGPMVKPSVSQAKVNHYSIMKLIEDNWQLGNLGAGDKTAISLLDNRR